MNDTLKVGDRVRIINIECPNSNPGKIIAVQKDPALPYCVEDKNGRSQWHYAKCLQKITDRETTIMQTENKYELSNRNCCTATQCSHNKEIAKLKLEVGKKYMFGNFSDNPRKLLAIDQNQYIFRNNKGSVRAFCADELTGIKEHREPYKSTIEGWVAYKDMDPVEKDNDYVYVMDNLLKKYASNYIYKEKRTANWKNKMYVRITLEQIEEPSHN